MIIKVVRTNVCTFIHSYNILV